MGIADLQKYYQGKKVLITGHTGFKGSWLSIWLRELGSEVIGFALDPKTERDNFVLSGLGEKIKDYRGDIRNLADVQNIFSQEKPDIVFHLAAQALVLKSYSDPVYTYETNIMGTINVLEAIRKTPSVHTAVIITSDKCYENREWDRGYKEDDSMGGYDPYSSSKGAAELVVSAYRSSFFNPKEYQNHHKSVASVRAGNVIGGGDWSENRLLPDCIKSIEESRKIEVRNPKATRPWQHVLEPLSAYLLLGAKMISDPGKYAEAWNFGPKMKNTIDVGQLVQMIISSYGKGNWKDDSNSKMQHEAKLLSLDISKALEKLHWQPVWDINDTIQFAVEWYKKYQTEDVYDICRDQIQKYTDKWSLRDDI